MSEAPQAQGVPSPIWPLPDVTRRRWTFGAGRAKGKRRHAGVDLYAPAGSVVLAPESGTIVATQRFNGPRAHAVLLQTDTGPVILLGEVFPGSWNDFGLSIGSRVDAGDPVARVGINPGGSQMLHYEMYTDGTRRNARWYTGNPPPDNLLDPTNYLQRAKALDVAQDDPSIPDEVDADDDDDDDLEINDDPEQESPVKPSVSPDPIPTPTRPAPTPIPPRPIPTPSPPPPRPVPVPVPLSPETQSSDWNGIGRLALVAGLLYLLDEVID